MKTSKKSILKDYYNNIVSFCSSAKSTYRKERLPLSTFSYPYPHLITFFNFNPPYLHNLSNNHNLFKCCQHKELQKEQVIFIHNLLPLPTFSYPCQHLVTFCLQIVAVLFTFSYLLPTICYPRLVESITTKVKTGFFLKLLKQFFKNLVIKQKEFYYEF